MKINIHTSYPSAFISSTFIDLQEERKIVAETLERRGFNVNALDVKPASTKTSKKQIIEGIRESDFIILIIGDRYGSTLEYMTGSRTRSVTWWEYEKAIKIGRSVLVFIKNTNSNEHNSHDDQQDPSYKIKRRQFIEFKKVVTKHHAPVYFSDVDELAGKVEKSLNNVYRDGVKDLSTENAKKQAEISRLQTLLTPVPTSPNPNNMTAYMGDPIMTPPDLNETLGRLFGLTPKDSKQGYMNPFLDLPVKEK